MKLKGMIMIIALWDDSMQSDKKKVPVVEALRYKPEGSGFDSRWCHWNFSLT
jgi:hypothetical protein